MLEVGITYCGNWRAVALMAYSPVAFLMLYASSVTRSSFKFYLVPNYVTKNKHFLSTELLCLFTQSHE